MPEAGSEKVDAAHNEPHTIASIVHGQQQQSYEWVMSEQEA